MLYSCSKAALHARVSDRRDLLLGGDAVDDLDFAVAHVVLDFVAQLLALLLEVLAAHVEGLDGLVHGVQLVEVAHLELVKDDAGLLVDERAEMLFRVLALLHLRLQHLL